MDRIPVESRRRDGESTQGWGFVGNPFLPTEESTLRAAGLPGGPGSNGTILRISKAGKNQSSNPKKVLSNKGRDKLLRPKICLSLLISKVRLHK